MSALLPVSVSCCCGETTTVEIPGPEGPQGPAGPAGAAGTNGTNGVNAYTFADSFTMPPEQFSVLVDVDDSSWMVVGQIIFVGGGAAQGYFQVISKPDDTSVMLFNLANSAIAAYMENSIPGTVFPSMSGVSPGGLQGSGIAYVDYTENRATLKVLASNSVRRLIFLGHPEVGVPKAFTFLFGDTTPANDFSIIAPNDNGGRYFEWTMI